MAAEEQSGGSSLLFWGRQTAKGVPVTNAPAGAAPSEDTYTDRVGHIIQARFPFTQLGLDMGGEQLESASITGTEGASKPAPGQIWGEGPAEFEVIPRQLIHILRPSFNVTPNPINEKVAAKLRGTTTDPAAPTATSTTQLTAATGEARFNKPCRLTFNGLKEGSKVVVVGEKRYGLPDGEVVGFTEEYTVASGQTSLTTTDYFDSWKTATVSGVDTPTINTTVGYDTGVYKTVLPGFGIGLGNGLTIFGRKGEMPFLSQDAHFNNITLTVGDDLRILAEALAGSYFNRRVPDMGRTEVLTLAGTGWVNDKYYPLGDLSFAPAWGSMFMFGDDVVDMTGMTMGIGLNLELRRAYKASRQRGRPRKSTTSRQVTLTPTTFFEYSTDAKDVFNRWQDIYLLQDTRPTEYHCYNWDDDGKEHAIICKLAACVLTEVPGTVIDGEGDIERPLTFLSVPNSFNPANDLVVEVYTDPYVE